VIATGDFTGKAGETLVLYPLGRIPARRVRRIVGVRRGCEPNPVRRRH
jgi:hypothetical protein